MTNRRLSNDYNMFIADEPSDLPCGKCGGVVFEFSVQNNVWNEVVRLGKKEHSKEYLCIWCFVNKAISYIENLIKNGVSRPETGKLQIGNDWPGVFVRGDDCVVLRGILKDAYSKTEDINQVSLIMHLTSAIDEALSTKSRAT